MRLFKGEDHTAKAIDKEVFINNFDLVIDEEVIKLEAERIHKRRKKEADNDKAKHSDHSG